MGGGRKMISPTLSHMLRRSFFAVVLLIEIVEASLASMKVAPDGSVHDSIGLRNLQMVTGAPDYFDSLRIELGSSTLGNNTNGSSVSKDARSSIYQVTLHPGQTNETTYRLAEIKSFIPFSDGVTAKTEAINDAFAALLAVYHFNNMHETIHPVLGDQISQDPVFASCNVKLTMELLDSELSATKTTKSFSEVLRRPVTLQTPPTTAVIGAFRSATTLSLAIYTGVKRIPQVSASATSTEFDDKEQFPIFGRTVTNTAGLAAVAVRFFQSIGSTHVAILFVTDSFGSAIQMAFQDVSTKAGIVTESLAFSSSVSEEGARSVVASLKGLQYRHIFAVFSGPQFELIMGAASEFDIVGPDYLYVFPGLDVFELQRSLRIKDGSPMAQAFKGSGLIQVQGGVTAERVVQGTPTTPLFNDESPLGYDRFRVSWREAQQDSSFVEYVRRMLPGSLDDMLGFNRSEDFSNDPGGLLNFLYDAVTAFGLSMCQAGLNSKFFAGEEVYSHFRLLDFEGASGNVRILNNTGTRDYLTVPFVMWNIRAAGIDSEGFSILEYVPSYRFDGDGWKDIPGNSFEFADGASNAPQSLPPVPYSFQYIGKSSRIFGYTLMGCVMLSAIASVIWTVFQRNSHVVDSAQPLFLTMVSTGAFTMASAIFPLGLEETIISGTDGLDTACMAVPWLYFLGETVAISALLVKTKAVHQAFLDPELDTIRVSTLDIVWFGVIFLTPNFGFLVVWSFVAPLVWTRTQKDNTDSFNRFVESYAVCSGSSATLAFVVIVLAVNVSFLLVGTFWAYRTRNISTEYNESRYIGITITSVLQAWLTGIPVVVVVRSNPVARFYVQSGLIFVTSLSILGFTFIPKMMAVRRDRLNASDPRTLYRGFKRESNRRQGIGSVEEPSDEPPNESCDEPPFSGQLPRLPSERTGHTSPERSHEERGPPNARPSLGIKIIHNPRSKRNMLLNGGIELSMRQLEMFEGDMQNGVNVPAGIDVQETRQTHIYEDDVHLKDECDRGRTDVGPGSGRWRRRNDRSLQSVKIQDNLSDLYFSTTRRPHDINSTPLHLADGCEHNEYGGDMNIGVGTGRGKQLRECLQSVNEVDSNELDVTQD